MNEKSTRSSLEVLLGTITRRANSLAVVFLAYDEVRLPLIILQSTRIVNYYHQ